MQTVTLEQVQTLVDQLSLQDQRRLLDYLALHVEIEVHTDRSIDSPQERFNVDSWQEFFQIGDSIAELPSIEGKTLTQAITTMRR